MEVGSCKDELEAETLIRGLEGQGDIRTHISPSASCAASLRVEARGTTMSGPNVLRREPRNLSLSLIRAARRSAASSPPRRKSGFTELSVGVVCSQMSCASSTPTTARSSGTFTPAKSAAESTSDATASFAAKSAHGFGSSATNDLSPRW